jgi:hypothetical protein
MIDQGNISTEDVLLGCADCWQLFLWTADAQRFYQAQGWPPPRRCRACRLAHKQRERPMAEERQGA